MTESIDILRLFEGGVGIERAVQSGHVIIKEGSTGAEMFVLRDGMVELTANDQLIDFVEPGQVFGELALLDGEPRSASAVATQDCQLIALGRDDFLALVQREPRFALFVMRAMARRVRRMNLLFDSK